MSDESGGLGLITGSLRRSRTAIFSVAAVYVLSVAAGILMVHAGSQFALTYGDRLVARARQQDPAAVSYREGHRLRAAFWDFSRNLVLGAIPQTVTGLTVVSPYGFAAYRGWVGGIVSVDRKHESRLGDWRSAAYYLITLILQLVPYSLSGGVGVHLGLAYFKNYHRGIEEKIWGYPRKALMDVVRVYYLIPPLFLIASLWEFLSPWN